MNQDWAALAARAIGLPGPPEKTRIVVAMSGGVDSSVVAALLKRAGYDVVGITLQLYDHGAAINKPGSCCAGQDIHDARRVADALGFPHYVLDYESRFRESVMEDFADTYLAGETPIPCVRCNQKVKFRDLLGMARDLGAQALATGHYVRRRMGAAGAELHRAVDPDRDQSYFLFATKAEQLDFLRFPLGDLHKGQVRALAADLGLGVADKPDSQDICFVPTGHYAGVVEKMRPGVVEPGEIVDMRGAVLGRHRGVIHYTVGQRRGLGIAAGEPLYVIRLDAATRRVVVGPRAALGVAAASLGEANWIGDAVAPDDANVRPVLARVRSTRPPVPASLHVAADRWTLHFDAAEEGVAPGQAAVFYDPADGGSRVLGGGWIKRTASAAAV